jgi:hypothetical protein
MDSKAGALLIWSPTLQEYADEADAPTADSGQRAGCAGCGDSIGTEIYAGRIHPRIATGLASLMSLQLRAIETTKFERRVAELEKRVAEAEDKLNGRGGAPVSDVSQLRKPPRKA